MQPPDERGERLKALRRSFDESFAAPPRAHETGRQVLLAIRAGGIQLAVRLGELAGVHLCRKIVPLPEQGSGLMGLAGLRGRLLVVYDLAVLLSSEAQKNARWLLVAGVDPHTALAVQDLEAYIEVSGGEIYPARDGDRSHEYIQDLVTHRGVLRGVLSIPRIVDAARRQT